MSDLSGEYPDNAGIWDSGAPAGLPVRREGDFHLKAMSALRSTAVLTAVSLFAQAVGFVYRVFLSRMVGSEVMGLYQLVLPVSSVLMSLTAVGFTVACSNLSAQYHALGNEKAAAQVVRQCVLGFLTAFTVVALITAPLSDWISVRLVGDARSRLGLLLLLPCVLLTGLENIHKHYFYGTGNVRPPAVTEICEQLIRTGAVLGLLWRFLPSESGAHRCGAYRLRHGGLRDLFGRHAVGPLPAGHGRASGGRRRRPPDAPPPDRPESPFPSAGLPCWADPMGAAILGDDPPAAGAGRGRRESGHERLRGNVRHDRAHAGPAHRGHLRHVPWSWWPARGGVRVPPWAAPIWPAAAPARPSRPPPCSSSRPPPCWPYWPPRWLGCSFVSPRPETLPPPCPWAWHSRAMKRYWALPSTAWADRPPPPATLSVGGAVQLLITWARMGQSGVGLHGYVEGLLVSTVLGVFLNWRSLHRAINLKFQFFRWIAAPGLAALLAGLCVNLLFPILTGAGMGEVPACLACFAFGVVLYLCTLAAQGVVSRPCAAAKKEVS